MLKGVEDEVLGREDSLGGVLGLDVLEGLLEPILGQKLAQRLLPAPQFGNKVLI